LTKANGQLEQTNLSIVSCKPNLSSVSLTKPVRRMLSLTEPNLS
jgi:hypothetical protein